jgi:peroxiredoxin
MSERRPGESDDDRPPSLQRLDPDRQVDVPPPAERPGRPGTAPGGAPAPAFDPRPYRILVGIIGLVVIVVIGVLGLLTHGRSTIGVPVGRRLHLFAAPLALSSLRGDANPRPTCTASHHDPRALNLCLLAARRPLVVAFFVTSAPACVRQVGALQTLSRRYPSVAFAAVAVAADRADTAAVVRRHGWTIPVADDPDGTVQQLYGVIACPFVELAARGGIVRARLIGYPWQSAAALAPYVRRLVAG